MDRRSFVKWILGSAAAAAAAGEMDLERLLFVPGSKTIFLPEPKPVVQPTLIVSGPQAVEQARMIVKSFDRQGRHIAVSSAQIQHEDMDWLRRNFATVTVGGRTMRGSDMQSALDVARRRLLTQG